MRAREAAAPRTASTPRLPIHVVFVDGHNAGPMDDGWLALFLRWVVVVVVCGCAYACAP